MCAVKDFRKQCRLRTVTPQVAEELVRAAAHDADTRVARQSAQAPILLPQAPPLRCWPVTRDAADDCGREGVSVFIQLRGRQRRLRATLRDGDARLDHDRMCGGLAFHTPRHVTSCVLIACRTP